MPTKSVGGVYSKLPSDWNVAVPGPTASMIEKLWLPPSPSLAMTPGCGTLRATPDSVK